MIQVVCTVEECGEYGDPVNKQKRFIKVLNHWNNPKKVVLEINGEKITVLARELEAAIENCTNTERV